jgi:hypothetical protein
MREKPIPFSTPMVKAILDGRKTMTRRAVKAPVLYRVVAPPSLISQVGDVWEFLWNGQMVGGGFKIKPPYTVGDHLYVRETWQCIKYDSMDGDLNYGVEFKDGTRKYFKFDDSERYHQFGKYVFKEGWRPSIFMPKEAARIWLEVTNVRVERLQEITYDDCLREGMWDYGTDVDTLAAFQELWQKLNAKRGYGWDVNPWVFVIEFKRVSHE